MNIRRNACRRVGKATSEGNQARPQAPTAAVDVPVNLAAVMDGEVKVALVQMAQAIIAQSQAIIAKATREGAPWENPHTSLMPSRLRDFTRMLG